MSSPTAAETSNARWPSSVALVALVALAVLLLGFGCWVTLRPALRVVASPLPTLVGDGRLNVRVLGDAPGPGALPGPNAGTDAGVKVVQAAAPAVLAGARVSVYSGRPDDTYALVAQGQTDANGAFTASALPGGKTWVLVHATGHARRAHVLQLLGEQSVELSLEPARALNVHVVDDAGAPLPDATVLVHGRDPLPYGALTPASGTATLQLGRAPYRLQVFARGFEAFERVEISGDLKVVLRRLGGLNVTVLMPDATPAANAEVSIVGSSLWPARHLQTDAQGKTHLSGLLSGTYEVRARNGSLISESLAVERLERGERKEVLLSLVPGRFVEVEAVTEPPERAVDKAQVVLAEHGLSPFPLSGETDAQGFARLGPIAPSGPAFVSVQAAGYVGRGAVNVPEGPAPRVRVQLLRGARVAGRVVDVYGHAIGGARVEILGFDLDGLPIAQTPELSSYRDAHFAFAVKPPQLIPAGELGITLGHIPFVNEANLPQSFESPRVETGWVSDLEGRFSLHPVPPGRVRVVVRHPAYVEAFSETLSLSPGQEKTVQLVMHEGGQLLGRVVDEEGFGVDGARVQVTSPNGSYERNLGSGRDGSFEVVAAPKEVIVSLARPSDPTRFVFRQTVQLQNAQQVERTFTLPAERPSAEWEVVDEQGQPVDLAQVSLVSVDPLVPARVTRFTQPDGRVEFADVVGLAVRVSVQAPGFAPFTRQLRSAPASLSIALQRGVQVSGRVRAERGHVDVLGAQVSLVVSDRTLTTHTNAAGLYAFAHVPVGAATLQVRHPRYSAARRSVEIADTGRADRPLELDDVELEEGAQLSGVVLSSDGEPVARARVAVGSLPTHVAPGSLPPGAVTTDDLGRFTLTGVAAGDVELVAVSPTGARGELSVRVESGDDIEDLEVELVEPNEPLEVDTQTGGVLISLAERDRDGQTEVLIVQVNAGSEAERAGLRAGDVLLAVDGSPCQTFGQARARLRGKPGQDRLVEVERGGVRSGFRVTLESVAP